MIGKRDSFEAVPKNSQRRSWLLPDDPAVISYLKHKMDFSFCGLSITFIVYFSVVFLIMVNKNCRAMCLY